MPDAVVKRVTVPGIKNTVWGALRLVKDGCDAVVVLGWVGPTPVDKYSYLAASVGLMQLQIATGVLVLDVTVHEEEGGGDERKLKGNRRGQDEETRLEPCPDADRGA
jgi:riboflavin synthase